ncbi:SusC/RagA family TonB-linked outer membrane protein [uncultured Alistipes sp.]|uniref:SusC/RagA family TonB-linked outer membrane protein n=1 Tax=uncultured Alistipes sp. TaxID=538949 RepID=UPI00258E9310|nr:SusC/RagA family TonB-linked outer membrane protein [uncultured Alistipes sp.]
MNFKFYVKRFLLSLFLVLASTMLYAQKKADITGTVYDSDGTTPAVGCAVTIEGTPTGVITDINGKYKIRGGETQTIVFSSLGYKTQKILIGPKTRIDVTLEADSQEIEGVVVTALGIKRDEKALGYAVTKVDNDVLTSTVSSNWMNALSGKVAGLNFDQASTGPGGSMRVTLRGETSINMNGGTALFVVDGVPITSSTTSSTSESAYNSTDGAVDFGNAAGDINPEDIENVSVLKGPAATALYGSRAANGAIIITTKSGRTTKGIGVTFSSSVSFEKAGFWPDFQYEYGAGRFGGNPYSFYSVDGVSRNWSSYAFGDKFDGHLTYEWPSLNDDGTYTMMEWRPRNFFAGFFDTGVTWNNNISVSGNNGKGTSVRVSVTDVRNDWIVPNTGYKQQTFSISLSQQINKYIKLDAKVNYYRKDSDNLPMTGYGGSSIMYPLLWNTPNVDAQWFKADYKKWVREGGDLSKSTQHVSANGNNPYYTAYEQLNKLDRDRVFGNLAATINFTEELSLILRCGMDLNNDFRTQQKPKGAKTYINGMYKEQTVFDYEMNNDFLLRYTKKLNDFDLSASFGGNNMMQSYRSNTSLAESLVVDRDYRLSNSVDRPKVTSIRRQKSINSFYGLISASWRNMIFLDVTGRNDWSSTLAPGNNSYFYPSVSGSVILSDLLHIDTPMVNFLKVRASWANVGNDTSPYQLLNYYNNSSFTGGFNMPTNKANYNLKPENVESWEFGVEGRFFDSRLTFDVAFYNATTTNQIISVPVDITTGVYNTIVNAGEINNRGWEVSARIQPVRNKNIRWDMNFTWSRNRNKVVELAPNLDSWTIATGPRGEIRVVPGGSLGDLYGSGYEKAPKGSYVTADDGSTIDVSGWDIVDSDGYPVLASEFENLGNTQADWKAGWMNSISYKNFRLSFSFSAQWGGQAYSFTNAMLGYQGKIKATLPGRYDGLIHKGVNQNADGTYSINKTVTASIESYYNLRVFNRDNVVNNTFSTSFLKMKDIRLEYSLPKKIAAKTKVLQGASIAFFATNLFCWTNWPQFDPEIATMNGSEITKGFETAAFPMTRTYGVNLKLQF